MRSISDKARSEAQKRSSAALFPCLITVTHSYSGVSSPLYLCNNTESLTFDGQVYSPFGFDFTMPGRSEDGAIQDAKIVFDVVDTTIAQVLLSVEDAITVDVVAAFRIDESGSVTFESLASYECVLREVQCPGETATGTLKYEERFDLAYPAGDYSPSDFPGLF